LQHKHEFNADGQRWGLQTLLCLQKSLTQYMTHTSDAGETTCDAISRMAYESHAHCYLKNGFCSVLKHPQNWLALARTYDAKAFTSVAAWRQVLSVAKSCLSLS
jgi:hypothetical protein